MTEITPKVFASSKVSIHHNRINAFLRGERIYPVTMEIDLTQQCTRNCPGCPYSYARQNELILQLPFLEKLFSILGPHTKGIVLTGGEPTYAPHFPEIVALAKSKGFQEIAVISNGSRLHLPEIQDALLAHVNSIRVSMYDWHKRDSKPFLEILEKIKFLRNRAKKEGSRLEIAAAMLTNKEWNERIKPVGLQVLNSGVDWLYFHPYCINWDTEYPAQADQAGSLEAIDELKKSAPPGSNIQVPYERYSKEPLFFKELYGSHFLIQVGADGINYAGPECKYIKEYALLDLNKHLDEDFLWKEQRLKRLKEINSDNFKVIKTKHRPVMFSAYLEKIIQAHKSGNLIKVHKNEESFLYPGII